MEDRTILELNLQRYRGLLERESDPTKRRIIVALIRETEAALGSGQRPQSTLLDPH